MKWNLEPAGAIRRKNRRETCNTAILKKNWPSALVRKSDVLKVKYYFGKKNGSCVTFFKILILAFLPSSERSLLLNSHDADGIARRRLFSVECRDVGVGSCFSVGPLLAAERRTGETGEVAKEVGEGAANGRKGVQCN